MGRSRYHMDPTAFGPIGGGGCFASGARFVPRSHDTYAMRLDRTGSPAAVTTRFTHVAVDAAGQRVTLKAAARSTAGTYLPSVTHDNC